MTPEQIRDIINARLDRKTHDQIDTYVENRITDLPSAKEHVKELTHIILFMLNNPSWKLGD